jgi:hypothetical protein
VSVGKVMLGGTEFLRHQNAHHFLTDDFNLSSEETAS